jgi:hypothetical protein
MLDSTAAVAAERKARTPANFWKPWREKLATKGLPFQW